MSCSGYARSARGYEREVSRLDGVIEKLQQELEHKEDQLELAEKARTECEKLTSANETVTNELTALGNALNSAMDEPAALGACKKVNENNEGKISEAISACDALISKLEGEIASLNEQINQAIASRGIAASNANSAWYSYGRCLAAERARAMQSIN